MFFSQVICQVVHQRESAHQVDFRAGGVEDAGITLFIRLLRDVNEAFIHLSNHLRIDGDLLIERAVFGDGEVVAFKEIENTLKARVRDLKVVLAVEVVLGEQTAVEVRG